MIDLFAVRAETPGCRGLVFLDSAGSSMPPERVVEAQIAHIHREAEIGGYAAAAERADDLAAVRASIEHLLGAEADSVALTDSATRAWSQFVLALPWRPGDRVLITATEYASNAITLLQRRGIEGISVEVVPSDADGRVDLVALESMLDERVRLVSLMHAPTHNGLVNPVREVVESAHRHGALVLLDACQSAGQIDIDVDSMGVDALSGTGRKWLRGPRGTGFLYVRPALLATLAPPGLDMRGATWTGPGTYEVHPGAARFELWESDVAARLGLGAAVDLLIELGPDVVERAVAMQAEGLRERLRLIPGVEVQDLGSPLSGIVTFVVAGIEPAEVKQRLSADDVIVSVSHASSALLDMTARGRSSVVRASPHYFVDDAQLDAAARSVSRLT